MKRPENLDNRNCCHQAEIQSKDTEPDHHLPACLITLLEPHECKQQTTYEIDGKYKKKMVLELLRAEAQLSEHS